MFARQPADDLLCGPSRRKAVSHLIAQVRLALQLETAIPAPSSFRKPLGTNRLIAAGPEPGSGAVAPQVATDRCPRPPPISRHGSSRYTACMQRVYRDPLHKAELVIFSSHRANTLAGVALAS